MSLLLEALKKAEKAKEEAQRRTAQHPAASDAARRPADEPPAAAEAPRVLTRDHLPDISQPLEILSDDLEQRPARARPAAEAAAREAPSAGRAAQPAAPRAQPAAAPAARASARGVFEAKYREPNPKLAFQVTLAVLGAFALGTGAYFWYQLRPPPPLVDTNPARPASERTVAAPAPELAAPESAAVASGLPQTPPAAAVSAPVPASVRPAAEPRRKPAARAAAVRRAPAVRAAGAEPAAPEAASRVSVGRAAPSVHPQVAAGYAAYHAGDDAAARDAYRRALRDEPENRDALLGLAAVETRTQRPELAEPLYERLLQIDPRDAHAQAGLLALRGALADPVLAESRLKNLIGTEAQAHVLFFTLGNQYARQQRWPEAQQAYLKALAADPDNADFAYNVAVSLDRMRRPALAAEYYERALALAAKRGAGFDRGAAERRARELRR